MWLPESPAKYLFAACAVCALFALAACGFEPVYGVYGKSSAEISPAFSQTDIVAAADRNGQILTNDLIDRMHPEGKSSDIFYTLTFSVSANERDLGLAKNAVSSRSQYLIDVTFSLTDAVIKKQIFKGESHTVVSYDVLNDQYGTTAADEDAINRGLNTVADDMVTRLSLFFRRACADRTITCPVVDPDTGNVGMAPAIMSPLGTPVAP